MSILLHYFPYTIILVYDLMTVTFGPCVLVIGLLLCLAECWSNYQVKLQGRNQMIGVSFYVRGDGTISTLYAD